MYCYVSFWDFPGKKEFKIQMISEYFLVFRSRPSQKNCFGFGFFRLKFCLVGNLYV
jgi:hypothetical protein